MENQNKLGQDQAFPTEKIKKVYKDANIERYDIESKPGMSKRFYAACAIATGLCSNSNYGYNPNKASEFAQSCYKLADELLKQENK